jgi:hypothetical protein
LLAAVEDLRIELEKARAAIYRATLRRIKRHGRRRAAAGASDRNFDSLSNARRLRESKRSKPLILGLLTLCATLGRVLELLIAEKDLFADRPGKILAAVDATNTTILEFGSLWRNGGPAKSIKFAD